MKACLLLAVFCLTACYAAGQSYADVQPIFANKCASCHRTDGAAPFPLETYKDIRKRTSFIKEVIETGYMPPWKPDIHYNDFANNRSLTKEERNAILTWIAANAPEGKSIQSVKTTNAPLTHQPDLVLKTESAYLVKGDNTERFIVFKIPFESATPQNIEALELYTNNKKIIHHINYGFYDVPDQSTNIYAAPAMIDSDADTAAHEYTLYGPLKKSMVYYSGWIPGTTTEYYPKQFGWVLPPRGVLILTVHYSAIAADEASVVGVKVFFKKQPVERMVRVISLGSGGIGERDITPKFMLFPKEINTFHLKVRTQETQSVMYVWPHMHYLGKSFEAYAVTPTNVTIPLVRIQEWDFRWQEMYRMKHLVKIPAGSVIHMTGVYDNTAANPFNPNTPPKLVVSTGDMRASDEMFTLLMLYVPYEEGDEKINLE
jgi:hypothetical protein